MRLLTHGFAEYEPWQASCIMLKPILANTKPNNPEIRIPGTGVRGTANKKIYKPIAKGTSVMALIYNFQLPVFLT